VSWACRIGGDAANLPFDQQLVVNRAGAVAVEAIVIRVIELIQRKLFAATRIGAVQERAMIALLRRCHRFVIGGLGLPT
jgi:hypothetical protein